MYLISVSSFLVANETPHLGASGNLPFDAILYSPCKTIIMTLCWWSEIALNDSVYLKQQQKPQWASFHRRLDDLECQKSSEAKSETFEGYKKSWSRWFLACKLPFVTWVPPELRVCFPTLLWHVTPPTFAKTTLPEYLCLTLNSFYRSRLESLKFYISWQIFSVGKTIDNM